MNFFFFLLAFVAMISIFSPLIIMDISISAPYSQDLAIIFFLLRIPFYVLFLHDKKERVKIDNKGITTHKKTICLFPLSYFKRFSLRIFMNNQCDVTEIIKIQKIALENKDLENTYLSSSLSDQMVLLAKKGFLMAPGNSTIPLEELYGLHLYMHYLLFLILLLVIFYTCIPLIIYCFGLIQSYYLKDSSF
jgi:hypothetical protein